MNFKRFRDFNTIELKPLTILTGPNSSGKSSVLESLVFLKQTFESTVTKDPFVFNDLISLGSFDRVLSDSVPTSDRTIRIAIDLDVSRVRSGIQEDLGYDARALRASFNITCPKSKSSAPPVATLASLDIALLLSSGDLAPAR